jgi:iron complex transport system substrate-binding protein
MSAYGAGSRFGIIHDLLGVKAADDTIEVSTHGQEVSYEYISQVNPDILFVVDRTVIAGGTNLAATTLDNELVNETSAATNNKIISLDPDLWYLSGGGLTSVSEMIDEVVAAIQ